MSPTTTEILTTTIDSPIGPLTLTSASGRLTGLHMEEQTHAPSGSEDWREDPRPFEKVVLQLEEYFAGQRAEFDVPMQLEGTDFQRQVWQGLRRIPYGETRSYGQLAADIGHAKACRAVGLANGRNPIAVIVPCHRVIGADGTLTGFGGGLDRKAWLLDHERQVSARSSAP